MKCGTNNLGWIDNASLHQILIGVGCCVKALVFIIFAQQVARNDGTIMTSVGRDLADGGSDRLADDVHTTGLVIIRALQAFKRLGCIKKRCATTGDNAFFNSSARGVKRVINAVLPLFHFNFG